MADVDRLRPYVPGNYPVNDKGLKSFLSSELEKIKQSQTIINEVLKSLEDRIETLEP